MFEATPRKLLKEIFSLGFYKNLLVFKGLNKHLLNEDQVMELLDDGYSFLRWGDGETALARGKSIRYQSSSSDLEAALRNIWNSPNPKLIYGIPRFVNGGVWTLFRNRGYLFKVHFSTRVFLVQRVRKDDLYADTEFWYEKWHQLPNIINRLGKNRQVILVSNNLSDLAACPKGTFHISVTSTNSFYFLPSIENQIESFIRGGKKPLVLFAAGPVSKIIINNFKERCQLIDIGHALHFYRENEKRYAWHS